MSRKSVGATLTILIAAAALAIGTAGIALASKRVAKIMKGRIIVSTKPFPSKFKSDKAFVSYVRKAHKWELKSTKDGVWKFHYMAFFAKPLDDIQVDVNFYDLTEGGAFLWGADQYTHKRGEVILASYFKLTREEIPSNHRIRILMVNRGRKLASTEVKFTDTRKFSGKVDFGEDEAD